MSIEKCWLTNQTGAIIRFRTSQLAHLPPKDADLHIELFDGRIISGRFHLHRANPYVAGPEVRRFILDRVPNRSSEEALIDLSGRYWRLFESEPVVNEVKRHRVSAARVRSGRLTGADLARILRQVDRITQFKGRIREYQRLLRPAGLRRLVLQLMGASCQTDGCDAAESAHRDWNDPAAGIALLEVHHLEEVARREDHNPTNLCVLCANHHRLIHGFGPWTILHDHDDIELSRGSRTLRIVRDMSFLR
ncbi:MAG: hypothetical protein WD066_19995 [Planctomycetaceae bacterium]